MSKFKEIMGWLWPIILGLLIALVIKTYFFSLVRVDGTSMYPNLQNNELVALFKQGKIKRGTVIVFDAYGVDANAQPKDKYVKRVIGLPGDKIEYKNDGKLYVNGVRQSQSYITKKQQVAGTLTLQANEAKGVTLGSGQIFTVPKGKYFVLGDNRATSNDSRYYGFVPTNKILGTVKTGFWNDKAQVINHFVPAN